MKAAVRKVALLGLVAAGLSACSWFGGGDGPKPAPLESFSPALQVRQAWTARVDSIKFPLMVSAAKDRFVVGDSDGVVSVLSADNGAVLWRASLGKGLSAGVGSDGRFVAAVTRDNELVVADQGKVLWRKTLKTPVIAAPLVAGERVFVLTVDRAVLAFDAEDGRRLWELRRPGEPLTLQQAGVLGAFQDTLVVGQGPRLAGVEPLRGTLLWEATVANPRGTNEVERLADLVGPLARSAEVFCARAFQSAVGCINAERGTPLWSRNVGGSKGLSADAQLLVGADAADRITAWATRTGDVQWTADQFQHRQLSAPLVTEQAVIFGDGQGYVHFLSRDKGQTLQRLSTDSSGVVSAPVLLGKTVLVVTRNGNLYALRLD